MSAATRVIAACAGLTWALLLVLLSAFTASRIVQAAATAVVAAVLVALVLAAVDSWRADRAEQAARIRAELHAAGNEPVDDDTPGR